MTHITVELTTPAYPLKNRIRNDVEQATRDKAAELGERIDADINRDFTGQDRSADTIG